MISNFMTKVGKGSEMARTKKIRNSFVNAVKLLLKNHQVFSTMKWSWMRNIFLKAFMKTWGTSWKKDVLDVPESIFSEWIQVEKFFCKWVFSSFVFPEKRALDKQDRELRVLTLRSKEKGISL